MTRCRTVFDTSSEERCWTVYKKKCEMVSLLRSWHLNFIFTGLRNYGGLGIRTEVYNQLWRGMPRLWISPRVWEGRTSFKIYRVIFSTYPPPPVQYRNQKNAKELNRAAVFLFGTEQGESHCKMSNESRAWISWWKINLHFCFLRCQRSIASKSQRRLRSR